MGITTEETKGTVVIDTENVAFIGVDRIVYCMIVSTEEITEVLIIGLIQDSNDFKGHLIRIYLIVIIKTEVVPKGGRLGVLIIRTTIRYVFITDVIRIVNANFIEDMNLSNRRVDFIIPVVNQGTYKVDQEEDDYVDVLV